MNATTRGMPLFQVAGVQIRADWSWAILALFVASTLASGWFPLLVPNAPISFYWFMGFVGALGLFLSIVAHELCHALVARAYKMHVDDITLFLFGGVARLKDEPPSAKAELLMAAVGPFASLTLAVVFLLLHDTLQLAGAPPATTSLLNYLYVMNFAIAIFNMLPGYPLDGGRVLRAALWYYKGDLAWATRIATAGGQLLGLTMVAFGFAAFFYGYFLSGLWSVFIGLLLTSFARQSYVHLVLRQFLHGKPVTQLMNPTPLTLAPDLHVADALDGRLYESDQVLFPIVDETRRLHGVVDMDKLRHLPESERGRTRVREIAKPCPADALLTMQADAEAALTRMLRTGWAQLLVVNEERFLGLVSLHGLLMYLSLERAPKGREPLPTRT